MIAELVKNRREALGYTQQEVADLSKISLRSVQRIEKGEVVPRMHTLKTLSKELDFSISSIVNDKTIEKRRMFKISKGILWTGMLVFFVLLFWAYLAQSSFYPETTFEFLIYLSCTTLALALLLYWIWNKKE